MIISIGFWERFWNVQADAWIFVLHLFVGAMFATVILVALVSIDRAIVKYKDYLRDKKFDKLYKKNDSNRHLPD